MPAAHGAVLPRRRVSTRPFDTHKTTTALMGAPVGSGGREHGVIAVVGVGFRDRNRKTITRLSCSHVWKRLFEMPELSVSFELYLKLTTRAEPARAKTQA